MALVSVLLRPYRIRTLRELLYLLLGLPVGIAAFTMLVTGLSVGAGLVIVVIGIPILVATVYANRALAWVERHRAILVLGTPIPQAYRKPEKPGIVALLKALVTDPQTWKDAAWMLLVFAVGLGFAVVAIVVWSVALAFAGLPLYGWGISADAIDIDIGSSTWTAQDWERNRWWVLTLGGVLGFLLLALAAWMCAGLAWGQARLAELLLGPSASTRRVTELTETRAATVKAQTSELRRIERDLHDGAQARLVAVTLDLGLARQKLDTDLDAARELLEAAHAETREAIVDLRRLVSGIAPAVLTDRGLDAALSSLVGTCRVPVSLDVHLPPDVPEAVQVAAYFVASEALANVQKHADAANAGLHARVQNGRLVVEVTDDGRGGADASQGSGLTGLVGRVEALDGTLVVISPTGGPTVVRAEIPCVS